VSTYEQQLAVEAERWSDHVSARQMKRSWLQSPVVIAYMNRRVAGDPHTDWFQWVNQHYLTRTEREVALSLGCNDGEFERAIVRSGAVRTLEGIDVSEQAIAVAQEAARQEQVDARFSAADVNTAILEPERYDLILSVMAMHHFADLEHVLTEVNRGLKPGGYFVLNEYVGASRFQWPPEQMRLATDVLHLLSPRRRLLRDGTLRETIVAPSLDDIIRTDPFEAIRAAEIISLIEKRMNLVARRDYGGGILHPMLHDIVHNFDEAREEDRELLECLCGIEEILMKEGKLGTDFAVLVAERRTPPVLVPGAEIATHATSGAELSTSEDVYAAPRQVSNLSECYFYHTTEIPGFGVVEGEWDLRGDERRYLGGVPLAGKRVLEIGAASGFLTIYMEQQGADVVAYDLSERQSWDIVPFAGEDYREAALHRQEHLRRLNNGFWLNHQAHASHARMVYGTVYDIPTAIGPVDVATFGSVLLHLRDPFLALQNALRFTRETAIVTDIIPWSEYPHLADILAAPLPAGEELHELSYLGEPNMRFLPQFWDRQFGDVWWQLTPALVQRFIGALGFECTEVTYHFARYRQRPTLLYTVVGHRTKPDATGITT
jgi:2-polyprenyl-3-methyl-5-hydroxy-6-metoxy-1,4-benzoquinol methylase